MLSLNKHIIFIGFKHVGKSTIGSALALKLRKPFIDLDHEIEKTYESRFQEKKSCRQIVQNRGELFFRNLENEMLQQIITEEPSIIALGGGTLADEINQKLVQHHFLIHLEAPRGIVFERIMVNGRPTFFSSDDPYDSFKRLWEEREKIYKKLAMITINNKNTRENAVEQLMKKLTMIMDKTL